MMKTCTASLLALALAACGGASSAGHSTTPSNQTAPAASTTFELGEITVFDGPDAMLKVHADGSTELGGHQSDMQPGATSPTTKVVWMPGPTLKTDGTIEWKGKPVAKLADDGTLQAIDAPAGASMPAIHVTADQLAITAQGQTVTVALAADGAITITNAPGKLHDQPPHVEGADTPGKRRAVLTLLAFVLGGPAPTVEAPGTPGPEAPAPAPAPATAPSTP